MPPIIRPRLRRWRSSERDSSSWFSSSSIKAPRRSDSSRSRSGTVEVTASGPGTTFWLSRAARPAARGTSWNNSATASHSRVVVWAAGPARR